MGALPSVQSNVGEASSSSDSIEAVSITERSDRQ